MCLNYWMWVRVFVCLLHYYYRERVVKGLWIHTEMKRKRWGWVKSFGFLVGGGGPVKAPLGVRGNLAILRVLEGLKPLKLDPNLGREWDKNSSVDHHEHIKISRLLWILCQFTQYFMLPVLEISICYLCYFLFRMYPKCI